MKKLTPEQRYWQSDARGWIYANTIAKSWNRADIDEAVEIMEGLVSALNKNTEEEEINPIIYGETIVVTDYIHGQIKRIEQVDPKTGIRYVTKFIPPHEREE